MFVKADGNPPNRGLKILKQERGMLLKGHLGTRVEYIFKKDEIKGRKTGYAYTVPI